MALPDFSKPFEIETDASDKGIGVVLQQNGHPIAYISKALGPRNQMLSAYEKECLAILLAVDHWRSYLIQGEFVLRTDQKALTYLDDQRLTTPWQQKALTKLVGLQYKLCYKKGIENRAAGALSRIQPQDNLEVIAISVTQPVWLEELRLAYYKFPEIAKILASLTLQNPLGDYTLKDRIIRFKGKILVPPDHQMQARTISALHASPVGGHSGFHVTYHRVKALFWWIQLRQSVQEMVAGCQVCQQAKAERVKYPGLLQPLPVPNFAWQVVTMDFIEGLP